MKMNMLLATTALIMSLALSQPVFSQQALAAPAAPAGAKAPAAPAANAQGDVMAKLPADKAKIYKDAIGQLQQKNKPLFDQVVKLQHDLSTVLTAPKFDKAAYVAKNTEIQKAMDKMRSNWVEEISLVASKFTPDERKELDNIIQQKPRPVQAPAPAGK